MILNTNVLSVAVSPVKSAPRHIRVNIGHAATGDKMQLTGQGRLHRPRAHRDKKRLDIQTLFTRQIQFFHDVKRIKLDADGSIGGTDFGQALRLSRTGGTRYNIKTKQIANRLILNMVSPLYQSCCRAITALTLPSPRGRG